MKLGHSSLAYSKEKWIFTSLRIVKQLTLCCMKPLFSLTRKRDYHMVRLYSGNVSKFQSCPYWFTFRITLNVDENYVKQISALFIPGITTYFCLVYIFQDQMQAVEFFFPFL